MRSVLNEIKQQNKKISKKWQNPIKSYIFKASGVKVLKTVWYKKLSTDEKQKAREILMRLNQRTKRPTKTESNKNRIQKETSWRVVQNNNTSNLNDNKRYQRK